MAFRLRQLEEVAQWCSTCSELSEAREDVWSTYFDEDDPRPVHYWPGAGNYTSRQRRFLGWFMLQHTLDSGLRPAQAGVEELFSGRAREEGLRAVEGSRYVLAIVSSVIPGRGAFLELEDERFDLRSRELARMMTRGMAFVLHVLPSRPGLWIPGPGWLQWPVAIGPNMRGNLKKAQPDPISVERLLQNRDRGPQDKSQIECPRDTTLEQAVTRMTEQAEAEDRMELILPLEDWERLVLEHLDDTDIMLFAQEVTKMVGNVGNVDEINRWLALAMNIWNTTLQPDQGAELPMSFLEVSSKNDLA